MRRICIAILIAASLVSVLFAACSVVDSHSESKKYLLSEYIRSESFKRYTDSFESEQFVLSYKTEDEETLIISATYNDDLTDEQKESMKQQFLARSDSIKSSLLYFREMISDHCVEANYHISERLVDKDGNVFAEIQF